MPPQFQSQCKRMARPPSGRSRSQRTTRDAMAQKRLSISFSIVYKKRKQAPSPAMAVTRPRLPEFRLGAVRPTPRKVLKKQSPPLAVQSAPLSPFSPPARQCGPPRVPRRVAWPRAAAQGDALWRLPEPWSPAPTLAKNELRARRDIPSQSRCGTEGSWAGARRRVMLGDEACRPQSSAPPLQRHFGSRPSWRAGVSRGGRREATPSGRRRLGKPKR